MEAPTMNAASQNFPHHLGVLRERMLHPTDYETAVSYFLEEFAGDTAFVRASDREQMPHLVSYLRAHRFVHGNARAASSCSSTSKRRTQVW
jgi:hypothetical protein